MKMIKGWAFVPGPQYATVPFSSLNLCDMAEYSPAEIADAILRCPGFRMIHPAKPSWWEWKALREIDDSLFIALDMALCEVEHGHVFWGGSGIDALCEPCDIADLLTALRIDHPAIWLHNEECEVHSPESFMEVYSKL